MEFEWDDKKSEWTRHERGFGFERAIRIFAGRVHATPDDRRDHAEERFIAIGETEGEVLVVVYTDRGDARRIISARRANRKERETWRSFAKA
jgi:uncharacterized DUF497 family protein